MIDADDLLQILLLAVAYIAGWLLGSWWGLLFFVGGSLIGRALSNFTGRRK